MGRQKLTVTMLALVCLSLSLGFAAGQTCNGLGAMCWSTATGVTAGGCCAGTQCSPWLPSGGTWDGSSPWYCLSLPTLADGATCDYTNFVGLCASGSCTNGVCGGSTTTAATTTAACTAQGRDICNDSTYPDLFPLECCSPYTCTEITGGVSQCTGTNLQAGDTCWSSTSQPLSAGTCGSGLYCDPTSSTCVADNPSCAETGVLGGYNRCYSGVLQSTTVPCCDSFPNALCMTSDDPADNQDGFCMPTNKALGEPCGKTSNTSYAGICGFDTSITTCQNGVCAAATTTTTVTTTTVTTTTATTTTATTVACIATGSSCFDTTTFEVLGECCSGKLCPYPPPAGTGDGNCPA